MKIARFPSRSPVALLAALLTLAAATLPLLGHAGPNQAPVATLTSPATGAKFTAPATIALAATATDSDGSVARVDFYNGTTVIATTTTAPYTATWNNVPAGSYTLKATAVDNAGKSGSSATVTVTVSAVTTVITAPAAAADRAGQPHQLRPVQHSHHHHLDRGRLEPRRHDQQSRVLRQWRLGRHDRRCTLHDDLRAHPGRHPQP